MAELELIHIGILQLVNPYTPALTDATGRLLYSPSPVSETDKQLLVRAVMNYQDLCRMDTTDRNTVLFQLAIKAEPANIPARPGVSHG